MRVNELCLYQCCATPLVHQLGPCKIQSAAGPLRRLHALFNDPAEVQQRHLAFMLLSLLGGEPGTLYREPEDEDLEDAEGAGAPAWSVSYRRWEAPDTGHTEGGGRPAGCAS